MKCGILFMSFSSYLFGAACEEGSLNLTQNSSHGEKRSIAGLSRTATDPLTQKSFQKIFQENKENRVDTLLARVRAIDEIKMYEATALNQKLFGTVTPELCLKDKADPISGKQIESITYFLSDSSKYCPNAVLSIGLGVDKKFSRDCLVFVKNFFDANNPNISLKDRVPLFTEIGKYYAARKAEASALDWFKKAQEQEIDKIIQAQGYLETGLVYHALARTFFEKAVNQDASVISKESGRFHLAQIAICESDKLDEEIEKVEEQLEMLISVRKDKLEGAKSSLKDLAENATIDELKRKASDEFFKIVLFR